MMMAKPIIERHGTVIPQYLEATNAFLKKGRTSVVWVCGSQIYEVKLLTSKWFKTGLTGGPDGFLANHPIRTTNKAK